MRLKDAGAQEEGFFQLAPKQFLRGPLRGFAIAGIFDGDVRMVWAPVIGSAHIFHPAQGQWSGKLKLPGRKILLHTGVVLIKAPPFDFLVEMVAVKEFSGAADIVSILLEKLGQENRVVEDGIVDQRTGVDVVARGRRADSAHDGGPGRTAGRGRAVSVCKSYPSGSQIVEVRRLRLGVALEDAVPVIHVIDGDEQNIWLPALLARVLRLTGLADLAQ